MSNRKLYEDISKTILLRLGDEHFYEGSNYYGDDDDYRLEYFFDKLKIISRKYYDYDIETNSISYKKNPHDIQIKYGYDTVYDTKEDIFIHGTWEKLLMEIYKSIDWLEEEKIEKEENEKAGKAYFNIIQYDFPYARYQGQRTTYKTYKTIRSIPIPEIDVSLFTTTKEYIKDYGVDETNVYEIFKEGNCVFKAKKAEGKLKIEEFTPGLWQEEIIDYFEEKERKERLKREQKNDIEIEQSIKKLRKRNR